MLAVRSLHKTFNGAVPVHALRGVDLEVDSGEFVAIMGPSGCGKSTLLHLIGGLDKPDSGKIDLEGVRIDRLSETALSKLRRTNIGFVFQSFNLIPNLSVAHNIELPLLLAGASRTMASNRCKELTERLGIADRSHAMPANLSGGEQQRVAVARAIANRPKLLLADEPTGNLDSAASRQVVSLIREFHSAGQTVVMVTHDPRVAASAQRIVRLSDGAVLSQSIVGSNGDREILRQLIAVE